MVVLYKDELYCVEQPEDIIRFLRENVSSEVADKAKEMYDEIEWERDELIEQINSLKEEISNLKDEIECL